MKKYLDFLQPILITLIVGLLSGIISGNVSMQYMELIKPAYSPPSYIFPIVWTILYILMGISFSLAYRGDNKKLVLIVYCIQLFLNFTWSIIFFVFDMYLLSSLWILLLILAIIAMMIVFYQESPLASFLQIPYLLWCIFAFILNFQIYLLN